MPLYGSSPAAFSAHAPALARHVEGLTALCLALKKRPIVRYERMSGMARQLGEALVGAMNGAGGPGGGAGGADAAALWDFRKTATAPLLLVLDRRNDPVTPLLTQWTYQAMVHELLGITNGRVSLEGAPEVRDEVKVRFSFHREGVAVVVRVEQAQGADSASRLFLFPSSSSRPRPRRHLSLFLVFAYMQTVTFAN